MTMRTAVWMLTTTVGAALFVPGCMLKTQDDASQFRDAIPQASEVQLHGPENASGAQSSAASVEGDQSHTAGTGSGWSNGPWAKYYGLTREVRKGVNVVTNAVLGSVWIIVNTQPTSISRNEAIWGPYTDSLSPVTYRFRVDRVGDKEYDYALEGRPKDSQRDADYRAVLDGRGWGSDSPKHGDGYFTLDLDTLRELDPFDHQDDSGTVKITHDLPQDITTKLSPVRTVTAEVKPTATQVWWNVTSVQNQDGTGDMVVKAHDDIDDSHATKLEDIQIESRWNGDGAGRADITLSGGDIPAADSPVTAVECWGADFMRSYYSDSISYEPTEGDATACVYKQPIKL